ncbi:(2Fe-2S) ferredoxin domain-containing protein [Sphaerisporangium krabiense]|uniref:(2Fe-2S) ferredoxin domain-containing protein n=1 Tax=Sphaerisporangium krabiense TaxID=763782 RepID=A0A7W9DQ36_9ACTN|nr:(2Fe-2S) ferredoxin domain-containing protein [Sphaerisporangium krabiense]MBB5625990.1 hypothetical protein [Sphaerisporangium krabiense]
MASRAGRALGCLVTVCRGCCCGTARKHPGVGHQEQPRRLRRGLVQPFRVRVVRECLGPCAYSNVVTVSPSREGRAAGGRPVWLGFVLDEQIIDDIVAWVNAGGPGLADLPAVLSLHTFTPPRRAHGAAAAPRIAPGGSAPAPGQA